MDDKIIAVHIGGRGSFGPVGRFFTIGRHFHLCIIEANLSGTHWRHYESAAKGVSQKLGVHVSIVPACISNRVDKAIFYLNAEPSSSSLYKISPHAVNLKRMSGNGRDLCPWRVLCKPTQEIELETTTLDILYGQHKIPKPQILSMDIQGSEYNAMLGASSFFDEDGILCIITEVEFQEMYDGQPLFDDINAFLLAQNFWFGCFLTIEEWYNGPLIGRGFMTAAEAVYLKKWTTSMSTYHLMKLALIANYFERTSYLVEIVQYVQKKRPDEWKHFTRHSAHAAYISEVYKAALKEIRFW